MARKQQTPRKPAGQTKRVKRGQAAKKPAPAGQPEPKTTRTGPDEDIFVFVKGYPAFHPLGSLAETLRQCARALDGLPATK